MSSKAVKLRCNLVCVLKWLSDVRVLKEEGDCIVCLEMRADELMRYLISGKLTNYRVVRTSPEPLQVRSACDVLGRGCDGQQSDVGAWAQDHSLVARGADKGV
jgi:hypothetical protein